MTVENLADNRIRGHLRLVQTSAPRESFYVGVVVTAKIEPASPSVLSRVGLLVAPQPATVLDDEHHREGAARFREQQLGYERHTFQPQPIARVTEVESLRRWQRRWEQFKYITSAILTGILIAVIVLGFSAWIARAVAQTPASNLVVRACPTQPTTTGWSACANSVWATPAPGLIVDAQRANVTADVWLATNQLIPTDRVQACTDPSVKPGPFASCPSLLANQTNNYLIETAINFGSTPAPPVTPPPTPSPTTITVTLSWPAVTQDNQVPPNTLTQPVSYQVFMRSNACATQTPACQPDYLGRPPVADVTTAGTQIKNLNAGPYCFAVGAYFQGDPTTIGTWSTEACIAGVKVAPGQVTNVTVSWQ